MVQKVNFPTYQVALGTGRLFMRYLIEHPMSLVKTGGTWRPVVSPSQDEIATAEGYYQGGRDVTLTPEQAADLPPEYVVEA